MKNLIREIIFYFFFPPSRTKAAPFLLPQARTVSDIFHSLKDFFTKFLLLKWAVFAYHCFKKCLHACSSKDVYEFIDLWTC